jgi:hypothetical protein
MVGLERTVVPLVGSEQFGLVLRTSIFSFIVTFGLVNNLNDGMSWGVFPLLFASYGLGVGRIGILKAVYPAVWGTLQVATGPLSPPQYARVSAG